MAGRMKLPARLERTIVDKAVPNVVGVDIGCGMYTMNLYKK